MCDKFFYRIYNINFDISSFISKYLIYIYIFNLINAYTASYQDTELYYKLIRNMPQKFYKYLFAIKLIFSAWWIALLKNSLNGFFIHIHYVFMYKKHQTD